MIADDRFEQALRSCDAVGELRRLAQDSLEQGNEPVAILDRFEQLRHDLHRDNREDDEDAVMDVMDFLSGWCSPHMRIPSLPPNELIGDSWQFEEGVATGDRAYLMDRTIKPEAIAETIAQEASFGTPDFETGKGERLLGAKRLKVPISVSSRTYDLFLNHVNGYRGHYAVSEQSGDEFNQTIIGKLAQRLIEEFGNDENPNALSRQELHLALTHQEAKIWQHAKVTKQYEWEVQPEIKFLKWIDAAKKAKEKIDELADQVGTESTQLQRSRIKEYLHKSEFDENCYKAIFGIRAPLPQAQENLMVKSAWLKNGEIVPSLKTDETHQLFAFGWT